MEVPERIMEKLRSMSSKTGIPEQDLVEELEGICREKDVKTYPDEQKLPYSLLILRKRHDKKTPRRKPEEPLLTF